MDSRVLGIVGGGQLGRMTVEAANRLNIKVNVLDAPGAPAKQINAVGEHVDGPFNDGNKIAVLAQNCDVLTIEVEHVDAGALAKCGKPVYPSPATIALIQDKYAQKVHLSSQGISVAEFAEVEGTVESLANFGKTHGFPFMLKSKRDAYDGKGNSVVLNEQAIPASLEDLKAQSNALYAEKWAPFKCEVAVMVVKLINNEVMSYPCVQTKHVNNVCHTVFAPAQLPLEVQKNAQKLAEETIAALPDSSAGVFGVEMFVLNSNELLVNEIAPRPHNSGHYTQDACVTSQFEAHVRACMGLPLPAGATSFSTPATSSVMLNVLGMPGQAELSVCQRALETPGCAVHLYGKESRVGRKLGHINIVDDSMAKCLQKLAFIEHGKTLDKVEPEIGVIMGSDSDLNVMKAACDVLSQFNAKFEVRIVSAHRTPSEMIEYAEKAEERGLKVIIAGAGGAAHLPGMVAAGTCLPVIGVPVKGSSLDGVDSLYSIVQMPRGVPVAAVAINNATNAALLALRVLGAYNSEIRGQLNEYRERSRAEVRGKDARLGEVGYAKY